MILTAEFTYLIYCNSQNKYTVAKYKIKSCDEDKSLVGKTITLTGSELPTHKITYEFDCSVSQNKKYGVQYNVNKYKEIIGSGKNAVVDYLGCGLFKGIGPKTAEKIYEKYGEDTIKIIESEPNKLLTIKGITKKKLEKILEEYNRNHKFKEAHELLSPFGFSAKQIQKVCQRINTSTFGKTTIVEIIKENPYIMCEINGITFEMADRLRTAYKIDEKDPERIYAATIEAMKANLQSGTVGILSNDLLRAIDKILNLSCRDASTYSFLWGQILKFIKEEKLAYRKVSINDKIVQYIYLPDYCRVEKELARIVRDKITGLQILPTNIEKKIDFYSGNIKLDKSQKSAITNALMHKLSIITGGPGTGKTTIIKVISAIYKELYPNNEQVFLAPTGRAARRITESTGSPASTIHSKLQLGIHDDDYEYDEEIISIKNALVVIDEFSMVDMMLAYRLFQSIEENVTVVIVGDTDQLMSVGAGAVLNDFIKSDIIPVAQLEYSHRQSENSLIAENAHLMRCNKSDLNTGNDFEINYLEEDNDVENHMQMLEDRLVESTLSEIKKYGVENVICLCPYKKYIAGVFSVNRRLQQALNPIKDNDVTMKGLNDMIFHKGDIVMHLKNDEEVLNGDIGKVCEIKKDGTELTMYVEYQDETGAYHSMEYTKEDMEDITLAYAMTVHKSQGSEYKSVVTCLTNYHKYAKKRNLIYTAITRAKENVVLFCEKTALEEAIHNSAIEDRHTLLAYNLRENKTLDKNSVTTVIQNFAKKFENVLADLTEEKRKEIYEQLALQL